MKRLLLASLILLIAAPAIAADFKAVIQNLDGSPIPMSVTDKSPLTLGKVCEDALIATTLPNDNPTDAEKKARFWLALKIHDGKGQLTAEETALALKVVGMAYGPLVIGRVSQLLDPAAAPKTIDSPPAGK